ncbi:MAG: HlyC/CorC family transporter, partial [Planctomycetota bacterium]
MSQAALFWTACGSLVVVCLAAIGARALRAFSRADLQELCDKRNRLERFGEILRQHESTALGVELLGSMAGALFAVATVYWSLGRIDGEAPPSASVLLTALGIGVTFALGRVAAPWAVSRVFAEPFLYHAWPALRAVGAAAEPLRLSARLLDAFLHRLAGVDPNGDDDDSIGDEIRTIVTEGHREGLLEEDAREMIEGIIELGDADVSEIMTPRTDMHMLEVDLPWAELVVDVIRFGHTRIPIYEGSRDDIVGVLYVKDLIAELAKSDP